MEDDGSVVTCMACVARLVGAEARREHYRSDWHRVNLKRKVSGLAPLNLEDYNARLAQLQQEQQQADRGRTGEPAYCETCSKRFAGEKALQQHLRSRRHLDRVEADRAESATRGPAANDDGDDDDENERMLEVSRIPEDECVFCPENGMQEEPEVFAHMARVHGFFVPYVESLADSTALLEYLGQKVGIGFACVCCNKAHTSVEAVRSHMADKSHMRMVEAEDDWCKEYAPFYLMENGAEDADGEIDAIAEDPDEIPVGLVLGDGRVAGHRSYLRYYKQNTMGALTTKVAREYRMIGGPNGVSRERTIAVRPSKQIVEKMKRAQLSLGSSNYYTRKARVRTNFAVLNSGYRP